MKYYYFIVKRYRNSGSKPYLINKVFSLCRSKFNLKSSMLTKIINTLNDLLDCYNIRCQQIYIFPHHSGFRLTESSSAQASFRSGVFTGLLKSLFISLGMVVVLHHILEYSFSLLVKNYSIEMENFV